MTLWKYMAPYGKSLPEILQSGDFIDTVDSDCEDMNQAVPDAVGPFFRHKTYAHEPTNEISTEEDFENLARHPENGRIAISYDRLPDVFGPVWETFPDHAEWDSLAPQGQIRNLKGREAAVAYREHGGEPYHYSVISYDERGRPEALLRYTENLGFDAVYYQYNSMNQVTSVTVADPFRQFTTWYGYDDNGRVDSVWTKLGSVGSGLEGYLGHPARYPATPLARPDDAEITYVYMKTGQVDTMAYPTVSVIVDYHYSPRKWLDTLIATKGGLDLFKEELTFDAAGRITRQMSSHGGGSAYRQDYGYDGINQLISWVKKPPGQQQITESYTYDDVGNREEVAQGGPGAGSPAPHFEYDLGRGSGPGVGPNQLLKVQEWFDTTAGDYTEYTYDPDGSMNSRKRYTSTNALTMEERFGYSSWRGLSWKYEREDPNIPVGPNVWEYRYRYNAMGEREQKREWLNPSGDGTAPGYEWTYYLLGGRKEQLSVWQGMQTSDSGFCGSQSTESHVYLYPAEYLAYGASSGTLTIRPDGAIEYRVADHIGSNRVVVDNAGTVISTTDYEPFGKPLAGTEDRKGWIDRERDDENELGNFGVRMYDYNSGRFVSVDHFWEAYSFLSPYAYSANNPMKYMDPTGMYIDLFKTFYIYDPETKEWKERVGQNRAVAAKFLSQLRTITGLDLQYDEKSHRLIVGSDVISGGSKTARDLLLYMINDENEGINVIISTLMTSSNPFGKNAVVLNPNQINDFVKGTEGVNPMTMDIGMVFFHEAIHTEFMGNSPDPKGEAKKTSIGLPDMIGNQIRLEMGTDWGQRQAYGISIGDVYYMPFSPDAYNCLQNGHAPESGYVKYSTDQALHWLKK